MNFFISVVALILCKDINCKQFRFDYDYSKEVRGFMKLHKIPATWRDARLRCYREGSVIASPETASLLIAMKELMSKPPNPLSCAIFTGIHATFSKGDFSSIEGTPLSRIPVHWAPDEPNNELNAEDCLIMLPNGTMADVNCNDTFPYICYKKSTSTLAVNNCGTVDNEYTLDSRTGSCYKFHRQPQVWPHAFATCDGEGGHLAIINSETEATVLRELYARNPDSTMPGNFIKHVALIGHSDWGQRGLWLTIHGQPLKEAGYDAWNKGEPGVFPDQFCGAMFRNGKLDDVWCDRLCPFICEKKPDSLLD